MADEQKKAAPDQEQPPHTLEDKYSDNSLNYISLHKNFWRAYQQHELNPNPGFLYLYLVECCNKKYWQNPFNCSYRQMAAETGLSTSLLPGYLRQLESVGLIKIIPGRRGYSKRSESTTQIFIGESIKSDTHTGESIKSDTHTGESIKSDTHTGESIKSDTHNEVVSIGKRIEYDTHTIIKQKQVKRERKKYAPPPRELIVDLFKIKYNELKLTGDHKLDVEKFIANYEFKDWRVSGRKITADNVEPLVKIWVLRDQVDFKRRDQSPTEPAKKMTREDMLREY